MLARREHYGDLALRRHFVGEACDAKLEAHLATCELCRGRITALVAEVAAFEARIGPERFVAGVEAKLEAGAGAKTSVSVARRWVAPLSAVAAAAAVILGIGLPQVPSSLHPPPGGHRLKGGLAVVDLYVGGVGGSRVAASREPLQEGERIRIAYRPGGWSFLAVISVDEDGEVSALYPEAGESLPVTGEAHETRRLPDSIGFTGKGLERIVVIFSDEALSIEAVVASAKEAFAAAGGDLDRMGDLRLPGEHFYRTVIKP